MAEPFDVRAAFARIADAFGGLDILLNNAATYTPCLLAQASDESLRATFDTNVLGPAWCMRAAIPLMRARGGGDIGNISSESVRHPFPMLSAYAASKAALETFGLGLRSEVRTDRIRVTTLRVGSITGNESAKAWDPAVLAQFIAANQASGHAAFTGAGMSPAPVADHLAHALALPREANLDYNDWHIDEWCGGAPGRFIPLSILPLWDIDACVAEAKRVAAKGCHTISFLDNPVPKRLPSVHSLHWDPLWRAIEDNDIVVSIHIGSGASAPYSSMDAPIDTWIVNMPMYIANATTDWLFSPIFTKFPKLKLALSEGGIGWIPYLLERANFTYKHTTAPGPTAASATACRATFSRAISSTASSTTSSACRTLAS